MKTWTNDWGDIPRWWWVVSLRRNCYGCGVPYCRKRCGIVFARSAFAMMAALNLSW